MEGVGGESKRYGKQKAHTPLSCILEAREQLKTEMQYNALCRYVKGEPFSCRRYTKGLPFLSKMVYERVRANSPLQHPVSL